MLWGDSGVTPGGALGTLEVLGVEPVSARCKASILPVIYASDPSRSHFSRSQVVTWVCLLRSGNSCGPIAQMGNIET